MQVQVQIYDRANSRIISRAGTLNISDLLGFYVHGALFILFGGAVLIIKKHNTEVLLWLSGLRIQLCRCSSLNQCCGMGLIPGLGTSTCCRCGKKKKKLMGKNITKPYQGNKRKKKMQEKDISLNFTTQQQHVGLCLSNFSIYIIVSL